MREDCESTCGDQQWDSMTNGGTPTYGSPCNSDLWFSIFWLADPDNFDHPGHPDYHDDHDDDHHDERSPWEWIFPDEVFIDSILTL